MVKWLRILACHVLKQSDIFWSSPHTCPDPSMWADTPTHVAVGPHQKRGVTDIVRTAVFIRAMCAANIAGGGDPGRVRTAKGRT